MERELTVTEVEKGNLAEQLPPINRISDSKLRDLVLEVWATLLRESAYHDINEAPNFTSELMGDDDETLVRHTNTVVKMSEAVAREFQQAYGINLNHDTLLAGAILHDVDKLLLYGRQGDSVELTELGRKVSHGEYGALVAEQAGLPQEVVNIIASHSPTQRKTLPASIEAVIVGCCDEATFQSYRLMTGKGLWMKP
ncbi:MAG: HDIG domain-containing protein [Desulfobacterales bacterium]|nr:HDIG domain-containing protein [Desulfobacterales bacterium]